MSDQVELLRRAAALMRARAESANTDDARRPYSNRNIPVVPESEWGGMVDNYLGGAIGQHCAALTPAVSVAVADGLTYAADALDYLHQRGHRPAPSGYTTHALAVARAYLGEAS